MDEEIEVNNAQNFSPPPAKEVINSAWKQEAMRALHDCISESKPQPPKGAAVEVNLDKATQPRDPSPLPATPPSVSRYRRDDDDDNSDREHSRHRSSYKSPSPPRHRRSPSPSPAHHRYSPEKSRYDDREHEEQNRRILEEEKLELLSRLHGFMHEKGYKPNRLLSQADSLEDVRYEFFRAQRELKKKSNVRMMQKGLVSLATGLEFMTTYYNPLNLRLQGFSKSMLLSISDYQEMLEELHWKYADSFTVPVEAKLAFTIGSSIWFYHMNQQGPSQQQQNNNGGFGFPMQTPMARQPQPQTPARTPKRTGTPQPPPSQQTMRGPTIYDESDDDEPPAFGGGMSGINPMMMMGGMGPQMLQQLLRAQMR